jgi:hypothetical protein
MLLIELFENTDSIQLPKLEKGETILGGRFKNKKMTIKSFRKDAKGQPEAVTDKGTIKLLKPRVPKLYPED